MQNKKILAVMAILFLTSVGSVFAQGGYNGPNQTGSDIPIDDHGRGILLSDLGEVQIGCAQKMVESILDQVTRGITGVFQVDTSSNDRVEITTSRRENNNNESVLMVGTCREKQLDYQTYRPYSTMRGCFYGGNYLSVGFANNNSGSISTIVFTIPEVTFKELKYSRDWLGTPVQDKSLATSITVRYDSTKPTYNIMSLDNTQIIAVLDLAQYKDCLVSGLAQKINSTPKQ